jgi:hypothetical protein
MAPVPIHRAEEMTPAMQRHWRAKAFKFRGVVNLIDPWRTRLSKLRTLYPKGTVVYRASTGGTWGKSAEIVRL